MSIDSFDELVSHVGHNVIVIGYGREGEQQYANVAIECETCGRVLLEWGRPADQLAKPPEGGVMSAFVCDVCNKPLEDQEQIIEVGMSSEGRRARVAISGSPEVWDAEPTHWFHIACYEKLWDTDQWPKPGEIA